MPLRLPKSVYLSFRFCSTGNQRGLLIYSMKKDAYYFSHDANAQDDPKCMMLIDQLGMEGYGIFWGLIEKLRNEPDFKLPTYVLPSLAKRWGTSTEKVQLVVSKFGLFVFEDDVFFSARLLRSMNERSEKARLSANYRWQNANAMRTHSERNAIGMRNDANKGKESKVNTIIPPLEISSSLNTKKEKNSPPSPPRKKHPFEKSPYFDKMEFKNALPDWSKEKLAHYYQAAIDYSTNNGGRYLDWAGAVKNWARKDEAEGKGFYSQARKKANDPLDEMVNFNGTWMTRRRVNELFS